MDKEFLIADFALQLADNQNGDAAITITFEREEEGYSSPAFILSVEAGTLLRDTIEHLLPDCTFHNEAHTHIEAPSDRSVLQ